MAKTRIYQRSEVPLHTNQNKALYTNQNEEGDFHQKYYKAVPINNDDRKTTSVFPENDKTPSTSDVSNIYFHCLCLDITELEMKQ